MNRLLKVMPHHLISILLRTLTMPFQSLHLVVFCFSQTEVDLLMCFGSAESRLVLARVYQQMVGRSPSGCFGEQQNSWFH